MTILAMVAVVVVFALLVWSRRWISDDGLIFVRTIRQILDGNGPVYNITERAEPTTSALWTWTVALFAWVSRRDPAYTAVALGGVFAVLGLALGMDGTRRLHRARGTSGHLVPAGALVVLAVFPFWDYATSGLDTSLGTLWLASIWSLLVRLRPDSSRRRLYTTAIVLGAGPLVRPDFGMPMIVFFVAGWLIVRPPWRRTLALFGAAIALPLAYEIFRAGYYGTLFPLPALSKSAAGSAWDRGLGYLANFLTPYFLYLPLAVLATAFVVALRDRALERRDRILLVTPVIAGLLMAIYVTRVGGDFMHGRMLLPATFMLLLPAMLVPLRRLTIPMVAVLAVWAIAVGIWRRDGKHVTAEVVNDERGGYRWFTGKRHPIDPKWYRRASEPVATMVADAIRDRRRLLITEGGASVPLGSSHDLPGVYVFGRLGTGGVVAPLDGFVADTLGLANPLGARITVTNPGHPGHEKRLPGAWIHADFVDPGVLPFDGSPPILAEAARKAMRCGAIAELLASVREPMSPRRFWDNLTGAFARTRLVIPADPIEAEQKFCGTSSLAARVTASSSLERWGFATVNLVDRAHDSRPGAVGYSSQPEPANTAWIILELPSAQPIEAVVLHPRNDAPAVGAGFPIDFTIDVWAGVAWVPWITRTDHPVPDVPQVFSLGRAVTTHRIRLRATRLRATPEGAMLQLAEIELRAKP